MVSSEKLAFCFPSYGEKCLFSFASFFGATWLVSQNPIWCASYTKPTRSLLFPETNMLSFNLIYCHIIDYTHFKTSMERDGNNEFQMD